MFNDHMSDYIDALERLAALHQRGILTAAEFEGQKVKLLSQERNQSSKHSPELQSKAHLSGLSKKVGVAIIVTTILAMSLFAWLFTNSLPIDASRKRASVEKQGGSEPARLIQFDDLASCTPTTTFQTTLTQMRDAAADNAANGKRRTHLSSVGQSFEVRTGSSNATRDRTTIAVLPLTEIWQGLTLRELKATQWQTGIGLQLTFQESAQIAKEMLKVAGLDVTKIGEPILHTNSVIGLEELSEGSALTCLFINSNVRDYPDIREKPSN